MAKKRKGLYFRDGFWTRKRLEELEKLFPKRSEAQLCRHFDKQYPQILAAYEYQIKHKKMLVSSTQLPNGTHTVYAAAPATGIFDFQHP